VNEPPVIQIFLIKMVFKLKKNFSILLTNLVKSSLGPLDLDKMQVDDIEVNKILISQLILFYITIFIFLI